jgi:hypothetical protein
MRPNGSQSKGHPFAIEYRKALYMPQSRHSEKEEVLNDQYRGLMHNVDGLVASGKAIISGDRSELSRHLEAVTGQVRTPFRAEPMQITG